MKYDKMRKLDRNAEIVFLNKLQPELSQKEIGERYEITAQRVSAILKRERERKELISLR